MYQPPQQPQDEPQYPQSEQYTYGQQPQQQQYAYGPPQRPGKPKNKTMKILAIIFVAVGLGLMVLSTAPHVGILFGILAFICDVMALLFVCLI